MTMGNVLPSLSAVAAAIAAANTKKHDGVRIKAPHYLEQHEDHRIWTSNNTWHFETGWVYHVTAGQVLHQNLNLAEIHQTSNVLTMHVDLTPLNVHLRPALIGIDVHMELSKFRKHVNVHKGHHQLLVSNFHQESQAVHIKSTTRPQTGWESKADIAPSAAAGREGTMTLEAERAMSLNSNTEIRLLSGPPDDNPGASLVLTGRDREARLSSNRTTVNSETETHVQGANSQIHLENNRLALTSAAASVVLNEGNLTTNGTQTRINGTVTLGQPPIVVVAVAGIAQPLQVGARYKRPDNLGPLTLAQKAALRAAGIS